MRGRMAEVVRVQHHGRNMIHDVTDVGQATERRESGGNRFCLIPLID